MRALTMFAGIGGADVGLRDAGIEHARCIEWEPRAAAVLAAAGFQAWVGDVRDPAAYADLPPIDLVWASPPCQDWSSAGQRAGASGDRNGWPWTFDALDRVRPTWFIAENVPGALMHRGSVCGPGGTDCPRDPEECPAAYFDQKVMAEARSRFAWADYRILDAADFGTPQFRRRVFVVAGPHPIRWPTPTHGDPAEQPGLFRRLRPWVTVRQALGLTSTLEGPVVTACTTNPHGPGREHERVIRDITDEPAPTVAAVQVGNRGPWIERESPSRDGNGTAGLYLRTEQTTAVAATVDQPAATVSTVGNQYLHVGDPGRRDASGHQGGHAAPMIEVTRGATEDWRLDIPSVTGRRRLTPMECSILQGLPADYPIEAAGTKTAMYRGIGNAVVPAVAEALARAVANA